MIKILTRGASCCSSNKGAAAMGLSAVNYLGQLCPDLEVTMIVSYPQWKNKSGYGKCPVHDIRQITGRRHLLQIGWDFIRSYTWFVLMRILHRDVKFLVKGRLLEEYRKTDLLIDLSGDAISDDYGMLVTLSIFAELLTATLLGKTIIIFPQSIGPFKNILTRKLARLVFNKTKAIMAREEITQKYLKELGINTPVYLVPDISFLLPATSEDNTQKIIEKERLDKDSGPLIGMSVSQSIARFARSEERYDYYVDMMAQITDHLIDKLKARVVFIPQVIGPGEQYDDRVIGNIIRSKVKKSDRVICINTEYQPEELRGIIGKCGMFVGARMHANIGALSMCVPTVAISYSHKTEGIMNMLDFGDYVLDFKSLTFDRLKQKVDDVWHNKDKIKMLLKSKIPEINKRTLLSIKITKEILHLDKPALQDIFPSSRNT